MNQLETNLVRKCQFRENNYPLKSARRDSRSLLQEKLFNNNWQTRNKFVSGSLHLLICVTLKS
jgi:hypothetical protein